MPAPTPPPAPPEDGRYRVLIVEDDPFIGRLVLTNLARANLHCVVATDGIDGLAEFRSFNPHLVISDIVMPGVDGRQLCSTIREMSTVPIILMTAADTSEAELAAFKAGADDYIAKPFDPTLMTTRVVATMRRTYRYDANASTGPPPASPPSAGAAPASGTGEEAEAQQETHWVSCKACAYQGPHYKFRKENSRGKRYMQCPFCQELEHFSYRNKE